ncbi:MAG: hypothetical protein KZQ85_10930 [Candidatus Thiodiazotropha sp. (ex Myrtea sp. 'scaly one' KF741663)]|nr:hypothetical protein [Candidatus Thiodiazotropha sp. (ex Myrtea sp. 'scaly one' KF741663)]
MKYTKSNRILFILFLTVVGAVEANTLPSVKANVTGVGTYETGAIFVFFDRAISSCSGSVRIDLEPTHDAKTQVLSIAMTALASGKAVRIHPGSCDGDTPIFGSLGDSFIYLTNQLP